MPVKCAFPALQMRAGTRMRRFPVFESIPRMRMMHFSSSDALVEQCGSKLSGLSTAACRFRGRPTPAAFSGPENRTSDAPMRRFYEPATGRSRRDSRAKFPPANSRLHPMAGRVPAAPIQKCLFAQRKAPTRDVGTVTKAIPGALSYI